MDNKQQNSKRLRTELTALSTEINQRINRLDELSAEIKAGYETLENIMADKQVSTEPKIRETYMPNEEIWRFAWGVVWEALDEFMSKAPTEIERNYSDLEKTLKTMQSAQYTNLKFSEILGVQVWNEVWDVVWQVVGNAIQSFRSTAAKEVKKVSDELQPLLDKQLALQSELDTLLQSGEGFYKALRQATNTKKYGK